MSLGLNTILRANIDQETASEIDQQEKSSNKRIDIQVLFENGMAQDFIAPEEVDTFRSPYNIRYRAVTANEQQHAELLSVAEEYFNGNIADAVGWVIKRGLKNPRKEIPAPRKERVINPKAKIEESAADISAPTSQALIEHRQRLGLSQRQLAAQIGMSRGLIADIELARPRHSSGALRNCLFLRLKEIANTVGISLGG